MPDGPLLERVRSFAGTALRDCWVIDLDGETCRYLRDDVAERVEPFAHEPYIDTERYGSVTRDVYEDLSYAAYQYTVRGFDAIEQFRSFPGTEPVGMLASVDRTAGPYDFGALYEAIAAVVDGRSYDDVIADETNRGSVTRGRTARRAWRSERKREGRDDGLTRSGRRSCCTPRRRCSSRRRRRTRR